MKRSRNEFLQAMKSQKFGVEIELTGVTKSEVKSILENYFDSCSLIDNKGRRWIVKNDGSIRAHYFSNGSYYYTSNSDYRVELVTPILEYDDIPMLQEIVRLIRDAHGVAGTKYGTGLHIHVSDDGQDKDTLRNLIRLVASKQYLLERALQIPESRLQQYCKYVDEKLVKRCKRKYRSLFDLESMWDRTSDRYRMLNLSSMFHDTGIELRLFNGTLHAGKIKAYIQFSLALCQSAKDLTRCSSQKPKNEENDAYAMRTWLCRMHLIGDEFKTCRLMMCRNLQGDSAFANPEARKLLSDPFDESELPID